ncbi:dTMP kinase [uncultured Thalassolituus sp.]|uniref:dTMP kinase n=1 Tax=uncultured Thalassolituus sp. TaxID=285273 RepID=UPI0026308C06|nr:dTMP kinase [uncultured Thalassolituus sp.]
MKKHSYPGRFITFEGGEGVGKSTNIAFVADWLKDQGITVVVTREPGGTEIAEKIRNDLLKAHHNEDMTAMTELLLVFAARAQHIEKVIVPALQRGEWVICDRFSDSTMAYQGYGRELPRADIELLTGLVQKDLQPDCTLLLDAPVETGMARASRRAEQGIEQTDRFELEKLSFFEKVRQGFLELAAHSPRFHKLDATQPLDKVQRDIESVLKAILAGDVI